MKNRWAAGLSSHGLRFLTGAAFSLTVVQIVTVWSALCGNSTESLVALFAGAGISCFFGARMGTRPVASDFVWWISGLALISCSCLMTATLDKALTWSAAVFDAQPRLGFAVPALVMGVSFFCLQVWIHGAHISRTVSNRPAFGVAVTVGFITGLLLPLIHGLTVYPMAAPVAAVVGLAMAVRFCVSQEESAGDDISDAATVDGVNWARNTAIGGLAIFIHGGTRYVSALMPITFVLLLPAVAVFAAFASLTSSPGAARWFRRKSVACCGLLLPVVIPLIFRRLLETNLALNATVDSVVLLVIARSVQLAAIWCTGLIVWKTALSLTEEPPPGFSTVLSFGSIGLSAAVCLSAFGVAPSAGMVAGLLLSAAPLLRRPQTASASDESAASPGLSFRAALAAIGTAALLLALIPVDTTSATQLLFSARASHGYRSGLTPDVIAQSTGFRLMQECQSAEGHLTVWRTSGDQIQLCRDGIPVGQVSANTQTTPQPIADTLPVLLPLVMHRNASSILLLGDDTGAGLRVCSDFPVHTVVASRPDPAATLFARTYTWHGMKTPPPEDERFTIEDRPVALTIRRPIPTAGRFDVVAAVSPNPVSLAGQEQLTPEFYHAVRRRLSADGVFCQRITRHDLSAASLVRIVSSMSAVFGRVVMLHMAPGEIAVVAGVEPDSLLDANLLTRLQREHVARALSHSGWDWSQVAALPAIDTSDPVGIFEHQERLTTASPQNAHFAFALPLQAAAWTDKTAELRNTFAPHQQRVADAAERGAGYEEFARRFSAVVQQSEILVTFPDQPWPYRRSLRTEMQRNPRPPVEVVRNGKVERIPDPRDEHRKDYFVTLGSVLQQAKTGMVDPLALRELSAFTTRHEPLLSYFAHHELVRIHEAAAHPGPARELRHRLHTVYFTEGGDFSVRHITDAIQQILDDPELVADDAARFDYVNSMLQELVRRWDMRRNYDPPSARQTQQLVDTCVAVAREALDALQDWSPAVGMDQTQLLARRKFINKALISPLRTYHEQVLAHRLKSESPSLRPSGSDPGDLPMLISPEDALTN